MAVTSYLSYAEYLALSGKSTITEAEYDVIEPQAQRYLDYVTFNRVKKLAIIPSSVKSVLTIFVTHYIEYEAGKQNNMVGVSKYSNGVETITFGVIQTESTFRKDLRSYAIEELPQCLICREVNFDFDKYLQSVNYIIE